MNQQEYLSIIRKRKKAFKAVKTLIKYCGQNDCNESCLFKVGPGAKCILHDVHEDTKDALFPFFMEQFCMKAIAIRLKELNNRDFDKLTHNE